MRETREKRNILCLLFKYAAIVVLIVGGLFVFPNLSYSCNTTDLRLNVHSFASESETDVPTTIFATGILSSPTTVSAIGMLTFPAAISATGAMPFPAPMPASEPGPPELYGYNKLMIVAHPDDELIWGGAHLLSDDYYVVCVTCEDSELRSAEFESVMRETGDAFIMLNYPVTGRWEKQKEKIAADLNDIIHLKAWDLVVTHNADGEYGHFQHIVLHEIVTALVLACDTVSEDNLYYFGTYSKKPKEEARIDDALLAKKEALFQENYRSQYGRVYPKHGQMLPFENWLRYTEMIQEDTAPRTNALSENVDSTLALEN